MVVKLLFYTSQKTKKLLQITLKQFFSIILTTSFWSIFLSLQHHHQIH
jgi:hypothetical protein